MGWGGGPQERELEAQPSLLPGRPRCVCPHTCPRQGCACARVCRPADVRMCTQVGVHVYTRVCSCVRAIVLSMQSLGCSFSWFTSRPGQANKGRLFSLALRTSLQEGRSGYSLFL